MRSLEQRWSLDTLGIQGRAEPLEIPYRAVLDAKELKHRSR